MCLADQSMNRWSLEEMVKRDPENFLILLQQIIRKTKEVRLKAKENILPTLYVLFNNFSLLSIPLCVQVQEQCQYELVAPLAIMFSSTLLQVDTISIIQTLSKTFNLYQLLLPGCFTCIKAYSLRRPLHSSSQTSKLFCTLYL